MRAIVTVLLLALGGPLLAQELSYNYVQGEYTRTEVDVADKVDGDGYGIYGSVEIGSMWHIFANFTRADLDRGSDYDQVGIGGGLHTALAPGMSLYLDLYYINVDASGQAARLDDDGLGTALGLRMFVFPQVEVSGAISYEDRGDAGDSASIEGEAWYYFTRNFAAGGGIAFGDDVMRYGIGARYYWD
jgi:hypothetical protein